MRIDKIASTAKYGMDEKFQNCSFLEANFGFTNCKNSRNLLIFEFGQFQKFRTWKIPRIFNLDSFENLQFRKFQKFSIKKIIKFLKLFNFENSIF